MRIGFDATCLPPFPAGAGRYILGLLGGLTRVDRRNAYFVFIKRGDRSHLPDLPPNFEVVEIPRYPRPLRLAWQMTAPDRWSRKLRLDVWHAPHYVLPAGLNHLRTVVTFHDMTFFLRPELHRASKRLFFQRAIRDALCRADTVVAVSETTRGDIQRLFPTMPDQVQTVYSGVSEAFRPIRGGRQAVLRELALPPDARFVLSVSAFEKRKDLPTLLKAFHRLNQNGCRELKLVLVGARENGWAEVAHTIERLGLREAVRLPGYLPDKNLPALYSAAELFVLPSLYEGFGFPVLEAMACGTPTLTSDVSATREIASLPEMRVPPGDVDAWSTRMHQGLLDTRFRRRLIEHGRRRAGEFSWLATARRMQDLYESGEPRPAGSTNTTVTIPDTAPFPWNGDFRHLSALESAVLRTVAYSDLFGYPLTPDELHRGLLGARAKAEDVAAALAAPGLQTYVERRHDYVFLRGRAGYIERRQRRQAASRALLKRHRRLLRFVGSFPFVRGAALSGAAAFENCRPDDDLDLFLLVAPGRAWMTYSLLALILKVIGKRTLLCLNYLFARVDLQIADRDFFVAHQIAHLRPFAGQEALAEFFQQNPWVRRYVPQIEALLPPNHGFENSAGPPRPKRWLERLLQHRFFNGVETLAYRVYGGHIRRLTAHLGSSVTVARDEIRLFTCDHKARTLRRFRQRLQELMSP